MTRNTIGSIGTKYLAEALETNKVIFSVFIDISKHNILSFNVDSN